AYASSGSSGIPTFWFRDKSDEETGTQLHKVVFEEDYNISRADKTLVVVCFSMELWVAGGFTAASCRGLKDLGFNIAVVTPGLDIVNIIYCFKQLAPQFDHVVLAGYPPFVSDILRNLKDAKVLKAKNFYILTAGDSFTENWRKETMGLGKISSPHHVINLY